MGDLTIAQAASKAGLPDAYLDRLIELGIIEPDGEGRVTKGDVRRAKMVETLENAGIGLEALSAGMRSGRLSLAFMDTPSYQRFATLSDETFRQVSERTRVPLNLLMVAHAPGISARKWPFVPGLTHERPGKGLELGRLSQERSRSAKKWPIPPRSDQRHRGWTRPPMTGE
ncbi:MAG TPA: hypothetical protein VFU44_08220, partial [Candidatus Limnocylindria bacterium]|nr:hypothetical protein [Candidatus Limnocylindria bacterium]